MRGKSTARVLQDSTGLERQRDTSIPPFNLSSGFRATASNGSETGPLYG